MAKIIDVILHSAKDLVQVMVVLDRMPEHKYKKDLINDKQWLVSECGPFVSAYYFESPQGRFKAFAGREFDIPMEDGTVEKAFGQWWDGTPEKYSKGMVSTGCNTVDGLNNCNVFTSTIMRSDMILDWIRNNNPSNNYDKYRINKYLESSGKNLIDEKWTDPIRPNVWWSERSLYIDIINILEPRRFPYRQVVLDSKESVGV